MLRRFTPPPPVVPATAHAAAPESSGALPVHAPLTPAGLPQGSLAQADPQHPLTNRDLDTGRPVQPSGYRLTDETYATLTNRLAAHPQQPIPPGVQSEVLAYYADLNLPFATKKDPTAWSTLQTNLKTLRSMPTTTAPPPFATYDGADGDDTSAGTSPGP